MKKKLAVSQKKKVPTKKQKPKIKIVIDNEKGLVFNKESDAIKHFQAYIDQLEDEYRDLRESSDFSDAEQLDREEYLETALDQPDQIWYDEKKFKDQPVYYFVKAFREDEKVFFYLAAAYMSSDENAPTFVFIHFPTRNEKLVEKFVSGELIFDVTYESVQDGAIEGDALKEGDPLSMGLYIAMLKLRSDRDIPEKDFGQFARLREETIESPDEIWRKHDLLGNILVAFIKEFPDEDVKDLYYVVVTQEENDSNVHSLLFSFPTTDGSLIDRYRQGENLQAEEVTQESSH